MKHRHRHNDDGDGDDDDGGGGSGYGDATPALPNWSTTTTSTTTVDDYEANDNGEGGHHKKKRSGGGGDKKRGGGAVDDSLEVVELDADHDNEHGVPVAQICVICVAPLSIAPVLHTSCGHAMHRECLRAWFEREEFSCPICFSYLPPSSSLGCTNAGATAGHMLGPCSSEACNAIIQFIPSNDSNVKVRCYACGTISTFPALVGERWVTPGAGDRPSDMRCFLSFPTYISIEMFVAWFLLLFGWIMSFVHMWVFIICELLCFVLAILLLRFYVGNRRRMRRGEHYKALNGCDSCQLITYLFFFVVTLPLCIFIQIATNGGAACMKTERIRYDSDDTYYEYYDYSTRHYNSCI